MDLFKAECSEMTDDTGVNSFSGNIFYSQDYESESANDDPFCGSSSEHNPR